MTATERRPLPRMLVQSPDPPHDLLLTVGRREIQNQGPTGTTVPVTEPRGRPGSPAYHPFQKHGIIEHRPIEG